MGRQRAVAGHGSQRGCHQAAFRQRTRGVSSARYRRQPRRRPHRGGDLAIEMGADAEDMGLTIHPHPTLSETINFAAEMVTGTITDLYVPKRS